MKATEQYFPVVLFIMLYKVVLTFESVDEILKCDHSNESYWAVLSCDTVYYAVQGGSNFWVCRWNPKVWPFVVLYHHAVKDRQTDRQTDRLSRTKTDLADRNLSSFMRRVNSLFENYRPNSLALNENNTNLTSHLDLRSNVKKVLSCHQLLLLINTNRKLNFYASFKKDIRQERIPKIKLPFDIFRLRNHTIRIEMGRHSLPKSPMQLRICPFCNSGETEDEKHVLFSWSL